MRFSFFHSSFCPFLCPLSLRPPFRLAYISLRAVRSPPRPTPTLIQESPAASGGIRRIPLIWRAYVDISLPRQQPATLRREGPRALRPLSSSPVSVVLGNRQDAMCWRPPLRRSRKAIARPATWQEEGNPLKGTTWRAHCVLTHGLSAEYDKENTLLVSNFTRFSAGRAGETTKTLKRGNPEFKKFKVRPFKRFSGFA